LGCEYLSRVGTTGTIPLRACRRVLSPRRRVPLLPSVSGQNGRSPLRRSRPPRASRRVSSFVGLARRPAPSARLNPAEVYALSQTPVSARLGRAGSCASHAPVLQCLRWRCRRSGEGCDIPTQQRFERASGLRVSGMICVGNCPILLIEGEFYQYINPSAKCISTFGLTFCAKRGRKRKRGWCECVFYSTCE
jgi:hypothetical protein